MTELLLGMGIAAATGYGLFERWRRRHDESTARAQALSSESIRQATELQAEAARQSRATAEAALESSRLIHDGITQAREMSKVHAESAISAKLAVESIIDGMAQVADIWDKKAAQDAARWTAEEAATAARMAAEDASLRSAMQIMKEASESAQASATAASRSAEAVVEAAELYCEQLNVPRRSDAAQRRRWEAFTSAIKDGADPLDALKGVS